MPNWPLPARWSIGAGRWPHHRCAAMLKGKRLPCLYQELPGGHNWTSWRAHLKDLLAFLWKAQPTTRRTAINKTQVKRSARKPRQ
jgi:hypothetical protein